MTLPDSSDLLSANSVTVPDSLLPHIDNLRTMRRRESSIAACHAALEQWPAFRRIALEEWRQLREDPDASTTDNLLPLVGLILAGNQRDPDFLFLLLEASKMTHYGRARLFGDVIHSTGPALMSLMAGTHPEGVQLLEAAARPDPGQDILMQYLALEALALMVWENKHPRNLFDQFVRSCAQELEKDIFGRDAAERRQWLTNALTELGPGKLTETVRGWFRDGLMEMGSLPILDEEYFEKRLACGDAGEPWQCRMEMTEILDDPANFMQWMWGRPWSLRSSPLNSTPPTARPVRSPPRIGRNEPCTCGSGKKYKKCCG